MKIGTKSLLFGVHQFLWHPYTVARAWRFLHGRWPNFPEWVCIFCHDLGYWGKPNMDGPEGRTHPERGARIAGRVLYYYARWKGHEPEDAKFFESLYHDFTLLHSRYYARRYSREVSELFLPDKLCILFEPRWWYLLRAGLSGEIWEYVANAPEKFERWVHWHAWYETKVLALLTNPKPKP